MGEDPALAPLKRLVIQRTEGNPFFLEETVRSLVETGVLAGERGAYRLTRTVQGLQVPATAQAMLAARIDRLAPAGKHLLQAAAVIGTDVPFDLLQAIAEEPEDRLRRGLGQLQATEFLYETRLFPEIEYSFKHALTHEVAYGGLLAERRRDLHARIVAAMEALHGDRLDEQVERLAHHALRGEVWHKAVSYLRRAGLKAVARSANREAAACLDQALGALARLPRTRQTLEQAVDLRLDLRSCLQPLGELDQISQHLREAERLATILDDRGRLGWTSVQMSGNLWMIGHLAEARALGHKARAIAQALSDFPLRIVSTYYLGVICLALGDHQRADELLRETFQAVPAGLSQERFGLAGSMAVMARSFLARSLGQRGQFAEGLSLGREAVRIAERVDHPYSVILARRDLGYLHGLQGDFAEARQVLERGLARGHEGKVTLITATVTAFLGHVHALSGAVQEGLVLLEQGLRARESMGAALFHSLLVAQLGEAYLLAGRLPEARDAADRALALARERGERGYEAWAERLVGEIALHHDRADVVTAKAHYGAAMALAFELGMRPLVAHCHLGLGRLYRRTGAREPGAEHLATAVALYREMDMRFWLEQAEAARREISR